VPPPSNLPQRRLFVGRVAELQELRRRLAQEGVTVAVPAFAYTTFTSLKMPRETQLARSLLEDIDHLIAEAGPPARAM
jgi:hypothetical protein